MRRRRPRPADRPVDPIRSARSREAVRAGDREQRHVELLLASVGGRVYRVGTRRRRGDYQGTMQTPGLADLRAFLPHARLIRLPAYNCDECARHLIVNHIDPKHPTACERFDVLEVEVKSGAGKLSAEQREYRALCLAAGMSYVSGGVDAVVAWLVGGGYLDPKNIAHYRQPPAAPGRCPCGKPDNHPDACFFTRSYDRR